MVKRAIEFLGILTVLVAFAGFGRLLAAEKNDQKVGTNIGEYAPNFEVYTMDGKKVTLADYKGKLLFVNYWAWWCPPCIREAETLMNLARKYDGKIAFAFIGINTFYKDKEPLDPKEFKGGFQVDLDRFKEGLRKAKLDSTGYIKDNKYDEYRANQNMLNQLQTRKVLQYYMTSKTSLFDFRGYWERQFRARTNERYGIPVTYLIGRDGKIALDVHPNDQHWDQNDDILEDFIAGRDLSGYTSRFPIPPALQRKPDIEVKN